MQSKAISYERAYAAHFVVPYPILRGLDRKFISVILLFFPTCTEYGESGVLCESLQVKKEEKVPKMSKITSKELTALSDLLTVEQNLVAKYTQYASMTTDKELKDNFEQTAAKHQRHFDMLYANLK